MLPASTVTVGICLSRRSKVGLSAFMVHRVETEILRGWNLRPEARRHGLPLAVEDVFDLAVPILRMRRHAAAGQGGVNLCAGRGRSEVLDNAPSGGWVEIKLPRNAQTGT